MITLEGINRIFQVGDQQVHALDDINLTIQPGEYLSLMGPSGSGKSTLLNILGLLDKPTSGRYLLEGREVTSLSDDEQASVRAEKIGFVFQFFHLVPRMSAFENVELPLVLAGMAPSVRRERVHVILEQLGLMDRAHHRPDQLSGVQRPVQLPIARFRVVHPLVRR